MTDSAIDQILLGMLVNLICVMLTFAIGFALVNPLATRWAQRPRRKFFGLLSDSMSRVQIKLSNIYVKRRGTVSITPATIGFYGAAITEPEYVHALKLASAISTKPFRRALRAIAQENGLPIADLPIVCEISISPSYVQTGSDTDAEEIQDRAVTGEQLAELHNRIQGMFDRGGTYVLIGGPVYNAMVEHVLRLFPDNRFEFTRPVVATAEDGSPILGRGYTYRRRIPLTVVRKEHLTGDVPHYEEYFLIQKFVRQKPHPLTVFMCWGTCTAATAAAVDTLVDWRSLWRQFGDEPFAALYELRTSERELNVVGGEKPLDVWVVEQRLAERASAYSGSGYTEA